MQKDWAGDKNTANGHLPFAFLSLPPTVLSECLLRCLALPVCVREKGGGQERGGLVEQEGPEGRRYVRVTGGEEPKILETPAFVSLYLPTFLCPLLELCDAG